MDLLHHYEVVDLAAAERATYFELFQMLMSQPVNFFATEKPKCAKKPGRIDGQDRTKRLQQMATSCSSPEEALLICCSTSMSTVNGIETHDRSASRVCKAILTEKKKCFAAEVQDLCENLTGIFELWQLGYFDDPVDNPHFYSFIRAVDNNIFGDVVGKAILDCVMGHARAVALRTAVNSKMIPPGARRLAVLAKTLWNSLPPPDKKAVKSKSSKRAAAEMAAQGDSVEDQDEANSSVHAAAAAQRSETKSGPPDLRELAPRKTFMYGSAAVLTNICLRIVEHLRGLRFFNAINGFVNVGRRPSCSKCGKKPRSAKEILIMGLCGHASCISCFKAKHAQRRLVGECVAFGCEAPAPRHSAFRLSNLNVASSHLPHPFGSKIDAVLELLQDTTRVGTEDQVVIFVQFNRVKAALIKALKDANITHLDGSHKHAVEDFKDGAVTVCILDPESVNAAGW